MQLRAKKSSPRIKVTMVPETTYELQCPHCKTYLRNGFTKNTLRFLCFHCNKPIQIDWDAAMIVDNFDAPAPRKIIKLIDFMVNTYDTSSTVEEIPYPIRLSVPFYAQKFVSYLYVKEKIDLQMKCYKYNLKKE